MKIAISELSVFLHIDIQKSDVFASPFESHSLIPTNDSIREAQ